MQKKLLVIIGLIATSSAIAGKMYQAPQHADFANSSEWQSTQQAIKNAQQQLSTNSVDIQQTIEQQTTQIEQSIDSAMTGEPEPATKPIVQPVTPATTQ